MIIHKIQQPAKQSLLCVQQILEEMLKNEERNFLWKKNWVADQDRMILCALL